MLIKVKDQNFRAFEKSEYFCDDNRTHFFKANKTRGSNICLFNEWGNKRRCLHRDIVRMN